MKELARRKPSLKEIDKMVQELSKLLNFKLQKELEEARKEAKEIVMSEDIHLSSLSMDAVKKLAKECTIVIPIRKIATGFQKFSEEEFNAIEEVKEIKRGFELTQEELAKILGVSLRTVAGWLHFESAPRRLARDRISKAYKIHQEIIGEIRPQSLRKWLFAHNKLLGDTIYNLLVKGEFERVLADIEALKEGVYV